MKGDYEAVGAAGIFTVGTALAALAASRAESWTAYLLCGVSAFLTSLFLYFFLQKRKLFLLCLLVFFFACGCGAAGVVREWAAEPRGLLALPSRLARALAALIDSVPYSDDRVSALVKALVVGDRSGLGPGLKAAFRKSGASHLLALSGMHIGILYLLVDRLTKPFVRSPRALCAKRLVIILASVFYTLVVGAGPSITRACLFICLREIARILDRPVSNVRIFSVALTVQLFFSPLSVMEAGFQLSYLAMAAIFFLYPRLERMYPEKGGGFLLKKIWNGATLSLSCQLFTAPAAWYHFRTLPVHFLLTNLLASPLMTLVMFTALAAIILTGMGICPPWMVKTSEGACRALLFIIETVSQI